MKYLLTVYFIIFSISLYSADEIMNISITNDFNYNDVIQLKVKSLVTTIITLNNINSKNVGSSISALVSKNNKKIEQYHIEQKAITDISTIVYVIPNKLPDLQSTNLTLTFVEDNLTKVLIFNLTPVNGYPTYAVNMTREHKLSEPPKPDKPEIITPDLNSYLNTTYFTWKKDYHMTKNTNNPIDITPTIISCHVDYLTMHFLFNCPSDKCIPENTLYSIKFSGLSVNFSPDNLLCDKKEYTKNSIAHCVVYYKMYVPSNNPNNLRPITIILKDATEYKYE